jgi:hypothetical protein
MPPINPLELPKTEVISRALDDIEQRNDAYEQYSPEWIIFVKPKYATTWLFYGFATDSKLGEVTSGINPSYEQCHIRQSMLRPQGAAPTTPRIVWPFAEKNGTTYQPDSQGYRMYEFSIEAVHELFGKMGVMPSDPATKLVEMGTEVQDMPQALVQLGYLTALADVASGSVSFMEIVKAYYNVQPEQPKEDEV